MGKLSLPLGMVSVKSWLIKMQKILLIESACCQLFTFERFFFVGFNGDAESTCNRRFTVTIEVGNGLYMTENTEIKTCYSMYKDYFQCSWCGSHTKKKQQHTLAHMSVSHTHTRWLSVARVGFVWNFPALACEKSKAKNPSNSEHLHAYICLMSVCAYSHVNTIFGFVAFFFLFEYVIFII